MKALIAIFFVLLGVFLFTELVGFYRRTATESGRSEAAAREEYSAAGAESLPGLPPALEPSLAQARSEGLEAFGKWLRTWGKQVQDPRLAALELDYVVLLNLKDHRAARERFLQVKARIPPDSPVYSRIEKLSPAYEQ